MRASARLVFAAGALVFCAPSMSLAQAGATPADVLEAAAMSRAKGAADAPVTVFEIADFQCPYCARFAEDVFPAIDSAYVRTGRVQWVFVNLPLPNHRNAWAAAEAALCAGAAGDRFWQVHDRLFREQAQWTGQSDVRARLAQYARDAGVPSAAYARCVAEDQVAPLVIQDVLGASSAQISGTPAFIVNREQTIVGLKDFEEWGEILDAALARQQTEEE